MKQLYYALLNILRGRNSTIIKVVSLTLGLFMAILLFAKIAFELSYDNFYTDADRLYAVQTAWSTDKGKGSFSRYNIHPTAETIARHFPEEVESFTTVFSFGPSYLMHGSDRVYAEVIYGDSLYFQTLGLPLLNGNGQDLATPGVVFLSESLAREVFGSENPIGKTLACPSPKGEYPLIVRGLFTDFPDNTVMTRAQAIVSFSSIAQYSNTRLGWTSGGNFEAYVRLRPNADADAVNGRLEAVIANYFPTDHYGRFGSTGIDVAITSLRTLHLQASEVQKMLRILSLLGFVLLLTAALNYALISVSSLSRRAKAVGVHKCNGAGTGSVMGMFLWETAIVVGISVLAVVYLIFSFREQVEELTQVSLESLFQGQNLWAPLAVVALLFVIGGLLPGRIFATIPVTQVFRRYTEGKKRWKYPLLFVQFGGSAFLMGLLCVVFMQYHYTSSKDMGYDANRVAFTYGAFPQPENAVSNLRNLPYVEAVSSANSEMTWGRNPFPVNDANGQALFSPRANWMTPDFFSFIGVRLSEGRFPTVPGEILVNPEYVRRMGWTGSGVGEVVQGHGTVTGIIEGYSYIDTSEMEPVEFCVWGNEVADCIHVRLKEPMDENLRRLNDDMKRLYPQERIRFTSYDETMEEVLHSKRIFRNSTLLATLAILAITLLGLIGYTNDEVYRRSKEIAIRKINGSEATGILRLLVRDVLWIALPAVVVGIAGAVYAGGLWQSQFKDMLNISPLAYMACALCVLFFIVGSVVTKSWRIANENPVLSIKNE